MPFEKLWRVAPDCAKSRKKMPKTVPVPADEPDFIAGETSTGKIAPSAMGILEARQPQSQKVCHPKPPKLLEGTGVTDDEPGETYWKVANGIRLSGMPGSAIRSRRRRCGRSAGYWRTRINCPVGEDRTLSADASAAGGTCWRLRRAPRRQSPSGELRTPASDALRRSVSAPRVYEVLSPNSSG